MNIFFETVCQKLSLGELLENPIKLTGGITNKMYKIVTDKNKYAIKILNDDKINKNPDILHKIETSELIAELAAKNNINAINALKFNNKYIQNIDNKYILIFKWVEGQVLLTKEINLQHVEKIAKQLSKLHSIKITENIDTENINSKINFEKYLKLTYEINSDWAKYFQDNYQKINEIYEIVYFHYNKLSKQKAYVHKDLNRKNIIWKDDNPYIIDWETAKIGNPSIDFFNSAWFLTADVNPDKFSVFAKTYLQNMKLEDDLTNSAHAAIIEECNWLEFSLKRALAIHSSDKEEIQIGIDSIKSSITEIINYYEKIPLMLEIINDKNK